MFLKTAKAKFILLVALLFLLVGVYRLAGNETNNLAPRILKSDIEKTAKSVANPMVVMVTTKGEIGAELYPNVAPETTKNFLSLVGSDYYKGKSFFSVIDNNYVMAGEIPGKETTEVTSPLETSAFYNHRNKGVIGMHHQMGESESGNQFYITLGQQPSRDSFYTIFGQVREGMDVLDKITQEDRIIKIKLLK